MLIAILLIIAIALFVMDALTTNVFPRVAKTPMGLAFFALAMLIMSGKLHELM